MLENNRGNLATTVLVASFAALFSGVLLIKISDHDLWWHLALGREILQKGRLAFPDSFSFPLFGAEQYNGEWLADLLMFISYDLFGLPGVYALKFILLSLVFYGLYQIINLYIDKEQKRDIALAILSLVVVLFAIRFRLFIRPYLFSYLCFVFFFYVLSRAQLGKLGLPFWLLIPVALLWANTSKGAFLGVLLLGLYGLDRLVKKQITRTDVIVFVAVPLASLINPEGWQIYELLFGFAAGDSALSLTGEQQPLSLKMLWGGGWSYTVCYQLLVVAGALYFIFLKGWRNIFHLCAFVVFLVFSIALIRMIDFFALLAGLYFFLLLRALLERITCLQRFGARAWSGLVSSVSLLLLFLFVPDNATYAFGIGVKKYAFPEKAVVFLQEEKIAGRLFNSYSFGGYLSFFHPLEKVFIDGRGYHLYPTEFQINYLRSVGEQDVWKTLDEEWSFEVALLEYDHLSFGKHFARHLAEDPDWALVFWDEKSAIYLKRVAKFADIIARHQYTTVRPNFNGFDYLDEALKKKGPYLLKGIEDDLRKNPNNQEVRLAKVYLLFNMNRKLFQEEIKKELLVCNTLYPEVAMEYSALAVLYLRDKDRETAHRLAQKALVLNPGDLSGKYVMEQLGE